MCKDKDKDKDDDDDDDDDERPHLGINTSQLSKCNNV
jgi:hypothetical protein